jgi:zinc transport system substrate-binding protein
VIKKLIVLGSFAVCSFAEISVTTTIFPLYDAVKNIGGDKVLLNILLMSIILQKS